MAKTAAEKAAEAKAKAAAKAAEEDEEDEESEDEEETDEDEDEEEVADSKDSVTVAYRTAKGMGGTRTFTKADHGADFKKLAKEFAAKHQI